MRDLVFTAVFAVALTIVTLYVPNVLNPFIPTALQTFVSEEGVQTRTDLVNALQAEIEEGRAVDLIDTSNLMILVGLATLTVGVYVFLLQIAIERFFVIKYFESPHYARAARRAGIVALILVVYIIYRLFALDEYLLIASLGLLIIIELLITQATLKNMIQSPH